MKILQVAHHRNGICGIDFHAVLFQDSPDGKTENFLATVFPEKGAVAVVGLDRIEQDGVAFGANSWRGDRYEADLRRAIGKYNRDLNAKYESAARVS